MKIAITGHSAGIGQAISKIYDSRGYEVVGLSRRNGYNIRSIPKVASMIEPCDIFINNAQAGFAQTELLFEIWRRWKGQQKLIVNISTMLTTIPSAFSEDLDEYRVQKVALEEASRQLAARGFPLITIVRPGGVATQPNNTRKDHADVDVWAEKLVKCLDLVQPELRLYEISLGVDYLGS